MSTGMSLKQRMKSYLKTNWGAPFVLAFIALLIGSAVLLSLGKADQANSIAIYAFYALVLGVALQIASYVKFGEEGAEKEGRKEGAKRPAYSPAAPLRTFHTITRKTLAIIIVALIIIAAVGTTLYYTPSINPFTSQTVTTHKTIGHLVAGVNFLKVSSGVNSSVDILFGINETGGVQPFNFTAYWSDGINQTNEVGVFLRSFTNNQSIPSSAKVVVRSSDNQSATVVVTIPPVTRTSTTTTTTTTTQNTTSTSPYPSVIFRESGLKSGQLWSVNLGVLSKNSTSNQIEFNLPSGYYSYSASETYSKNYSWALVAQPDTGQLFVNQTRIVVNITYSIVNVTTPVNQLFNLTAGPSITMLNGRQGLNFTYTNSFPVQIGGIVLITVSNSTTGQILLLQTATIAPPSGKSVTAIVMFSGLGSGNYSLSIYVQTSSGVRLSNVTNTKITLA